MLTGPPLTAAVEQLEPVPAEFQVAIAATVEWDAAPKPVCVARAAWAWWSRVGQEPVTTLETQVTNQDGVVVVNGTAVVWRDP